MNKIDIFEFCILVVLLYLSGFFSSCETAFTTVGRVELRAREEDGDPRAKTVLRIQEKYATMLCSVLIGNNVVNLTASALATALTIRAAGSHMVGITTGVITFVVLIFGEIIPKRRAAAESLEFSLKFAALMYWYMLILTPLVVLVEAISGGIAKLLHINVDNNVGTITEEELKSYVDVSHEDGAIESEEMEMIHNVFDFNDAMAKDIMIPRVDMVTVDQSAGYREIREKFRESMFSRIPVYQDAENPDNMLGIVNIKDFLLVDDPEQFSIADILRNAYFTVETKKIVDLLSEMREKACGVTFVLNEYGETVGMITMEDLLEELVGEIRDEYDAEEVELIHKIRDRVYQIDASVKLDDINDRLGTSFDSTHYKSLGGIMIESLERVPADGDTVTLPNGILLKVRGMQGHRIDQILLILPKEEKLAE